jgi:HEAT repeat protein
VSFDLGTPEPLQTESSAQLIAIGVRAVPFLAQQIENAPSNRRAAYIALALHRIGDPQALPLLIDLLAHYRRIEHPSPWDLAVIGQCTLAIARLRHE